MESALYGIYARVVFVSGILLVRCAHSFDFWYVNNSCVNTVRQHCHEVFSIYRVFRCSKILGEASKQEILQQMFRKF